MPKYEVEIVKTITVDADDYDHVMTILEHDHYDRESIGKITELDEDGEPFDYIICGKED